MKPYVQFCLDRFRAWGLDRCLRAAVLVLAALLVLQGGRYLFAGHSARALAQRVKTIAATPERSDRKPFTEYAAILDKGLIGKKESGRGGAPPPLNVYGVLGNKALVGGSPNDATLVEVGKPLPNGETLAEVTPTGIVLEKDGKKRTQTVFPSLGTSDTPKAPEPPATPPPSAEPKTN